MHVSERVCESICVIQEDHRHDVHLARSTHAQHGRHGGVEECAVGKLEEEEQFIRGVIIEDAPLLATAELAPPAYRPSIANPPQEEHLSVRPEATQCDVHLPSEAQRPGMHLYTRRRLQSPSQPP